MSITGWLVFLFFCVWLVHASLQWMWQAAKYEKLVDDLVDAYQKLTQIEDKLERMENAIEEIEEQTQCDLIVTREAK